MPLQTSTSSSARQRATRVLSSSLIGWLSLLPVSEVQWALTLAGGGVPMAASDKATGRGSRHSSWMPPPLLALASLGCSPWCGSLDGPPAPLLQDNNTFTGVHRERTSTLVPTFCTVAHSGQILNGGDVGLWVQRQCHRSRQKVKKVPVA